jgi:hypothetical protein
MKREARINELKANTRLMSLVRDYLEDGNYDRLEKRLNLFNLHISYNELGDLIDLA